MNTEIETLPVKISKILDSNSIAEESVISYFRKGGLFSSKTHYVLTRQKLFVLDGKKLISEKSNLADSESNVYLTNEFELLTNKRLIALNGVVDGDLSVSNEIDLLDDGEMFVAFLLGTFGIAGQHHGDVESDTQMDLALRVKFNVLTNKSLKIFQGTPNFELLDSIPLSDIQSITLTRDQHLNTDYCAIAIYMKNGKCRGITHGSLDDVSQTESFPRKICQEAKVPFAKPVFNHSVSDKILVEFYPKANLKWPSKCANCLTDDSDFELNPLIIEKELGTEGVGNALGIGPRSFHLDVPYCADCIPLFSAKAVKQYGYNGVSIILEFVNEKYAQEFIKIND